MLCFDIESDGLLDTITKIHCINVIDMESGREYRYTDHAEYEDGGKTPRDGSLRAGLDLLRRADRLAGQNIVGFDIPAIQMIFPDWRPKDDAVIFDTKIYSQLQYPALKDMDFAAVRKGKLPYSFQQAGLCGKHSLEAWGIRIGGEQKANFQPGDYGHTWASMPFIRDMDEYCMQDVRTNVDIVRHFQSKEYSEQALTLEAEVARIIGQQMRNGIWFDVKAAEALAAQLQVRLAELSESVTRVFDPWYASAGEMSPKRDNARQGYVAGCALTKIKLEVFNPGSRDHIADRLIKIHGWLPQEFTPTGKPKVDETILDSLPYPEAKLIAEYMLVQKRLGQVTDGKESWLGAVKADGRIYGQVNPLGAVTGRMTHYGPNLAQVPRVGTPYGAECRALFGVGPDGKLRLVGCDAEGLELRMLAHYMARYDGGAYVETVINGKKENGTDIHTVNQKLVGLNSRDSAKTFIYAFLYGAGNYKLGTIRLDDMEPEKRQKFFDRYKVGKPRDAAIAKLGSTGRARLMDGLPALKKLTENVKTAAARGYLVGLDGRRLHVRSAHAALNTLLQGGGACVMKVALVEMDKQFRSASLPAQFLLNIHDEVQVQTEDQYADSIGSLAAASIRRAGELLNLRCPLAGDYAVGRTWADTH